MPALDLGAEGSIRQGLGSLCQIHSRLTAIQCDNLTNRQVFFQWHSD